VLSASSTPRRSPRRLRMSEVDVRGHVLDAQRRGLVPPQVEIV
jgi:hypothetical protein